MGKLKDFFVMSRHERVGALALLGIVLVLVVALALWRGCRRPATGAIAPAMVAYDRATDSIAIVEKQAHSKKAKGKRSRRSSATDRRRKAFKKKKNKSKKERSITKPAAAPRRSLEPVPEF